jgi:hypothetical protein
MEDRLQSGIREGAGREESRYNVEFIDFLQKWGTPLLLVGCLAAAGFWGYRHLNQRSTQQRDAAWADFSAAAAGTNVSPESLVAIADQYDGTGSTSLLARLKAAEAYRGALLTGVKPGGQVKPDGQVEDPADLMTDADRTQFLDLAAGLYQRVLDDAAKDPQKLFLFTVNARFGLAAVEESRGNSDAAKGQYEEIVTLCEGTSLAAHAALAKERIARLPELASMPKLLTRADLPKEPEPAPATLEPAADPAGPAPVAGPAAPAPETPAPTPETPAPADPTTPQTPK